jgi:lipopolysaccharide transport system ATP-binding protein
MSTAIQIENVSKVYRLGAMGTGTLSHDLRRWWNISRGKEDPYLKVGVKNDRTDGIDSEYVRSLNDISFDVQQGESLGVIGRNGAGKSTLLKILSRITGPSTGSIKIKGRIASLLEVGTGFHPELTGRENIFLNGAILGMRKAEISRKLDEIIAFSGIGKYIDTPVKRYSSGMYVRLAFAVAAHLEPEILIVDEVLAVGDAEFQKKCLGKMKDVSGQGRTVIFVSHNMAAVKSLCQNAILLKHGELAATGRADDVVSLYLGMDDKSAGLSAFFQPIQADDVHISSVAFKHPKGQIGEPITEGEGAELVIDYTIPSGAASSYHLAFHLFNEAGEVLFGFGPARDGVELKDGAQRLTCHFPNQFFNVGTYYLTLLVVKDRKNVIKNERDVAVLRVTQQAKEIGEWFGREPGYLVPSFTWQHEHLI